MKNFLLLFFCLPAMVIAQDKTLVVEGSSPNIYLVHTTGAKENYYSIGRVYNISPRVMAPFNNLILENGLSIGQVIKVPLTEQNFSQDGNAVDDEVLVPLYHKVKGKETLSQVSRTYHNVPVDVLKKWNKMNSDVLTNGSMLMIGYLKVKKELSPYASKAVKAEIITRSSAPVEIPKVSPPVVAETKTPAKTNVNEQPVPVKVIETKSVATGSAGTDRSFNGGAFKGSFNGQALMNKTESGIAGIFKSTSGWEDGKYYCLHNSATAGTIIKITNAANNKVVYAKVLDVIPDLKQNDGMILRLSNAAADELKVTESTFNCTINY